MQYQQINKKAWDERTNIHFESTFYNVDGFKSGISTLNELEKELLGDVSNRQLLHLQCHFGLDTLSLARFGATVTGVDLSNDAILKARALATECGISATFICSDVLKLREVHSHSYDTVYTSYGVLCWLPNLTKWAEVVADSLKAGGEFHLVEFHPFNDVMLGYPYFHDENAIKELESTYTENSGDALQEIMTWGHSLSDVINALIQAGLEIISFKEYDFSPYDCFEGLTKTAPNRFQSIKNGVAMPLLYSISARKPEIL